MSVPTFVLILCVNGGRQSWRRLLFACHATQHTHTHTRTDARTIINFAGRPCLFLPFFDLSCVSCRLCGAVASLLHVVSVGFSFSLVVLFVFVSQSVSWSHTHKLLLMRLVTSIAHWASSSVRLVLSVSLPSIHSFSLPFLVRQPRTHPIHITDVLRVRCAVSFALCSLMRVGE